MPAKSGGGPRGPFTKEEVSFVKAVYPGLGPAAIARKLGRSRSGVNALIKRLRESGEIEPRATAPEPAGQSTDEPPSPGPGSGRLEELRWLAGVLRRSILAADAPRDVARLSEEYRAVLVEVERLEHDGEGGGSIAELLATVSISVPQGP